MTLVVKVLKMATLLNIVPILLQEYGEDGGAAPSFTTAGFQVHWGLSEQGAGVRFHELSAAEGFQRTGVAIGGFRLTLRESFRLFKH